MKDFTTKEYITPIIDEINALYKPITEKAILEALHCDLLLQSKHTKNAYAVRAKQPFYYSFGLADKLFKTVEKYASTAETENGELDTWLYSEKKRINEAIRDALLLKYTA